MLLFIILITIIIVLYNTYEYYKKQNKEMFKLLCYFKEPYYEQDDFNHSQPIFDYIDKNGFNKKIIYDKSKWL
jgi:hypothetical protein